MAHVRKKFEISERRTCQVVDQPYSTQRYVARKAGKDRALANKMITLSHENPRYGLWWQKEGLKVPSSQRESDGGWAPLREDAPGG